VSLAGLLAGLLVKPALVLGIACAIVALLRRSTAAARHAVWAGAIGATILLPALTLLLPPLRLGLPEIGRAAPAADAVQWNPRLERGAAELTGVPSGRELRETDGDGPDRVEWITRGLFLLWITGLLLFAGRRVAAEVRARRIVRRAGPMKNPRFRQLFTDIARSTGIRAGLRKSEMLSSPAVTGLIRPVVLLPSGADAWSESDFRASVIHELGHVSRGDLTLNLLGDLAAMVYWCNPAVAWAVRRMRVESEAACDDLVLGSGAEPGAYAQLLLASAAAESTGGSPAPAVTGMARPRELESRLLNVLDPRVPRHPLPHWWTASLAALGLLVALPAAALTTAPEGRPTQPVTGEPDRQADSLSHPSSERVPLSAIPLRFPRTAATLKGPDSVLAVLLGEALDRVPEHEGDLVRERAAWALSQIRDGRLLEPLLAALEAPDWRVQAYAAWALAPARDPRAVPGFIRQLRHPVWRLRAMAAYALGEARNPRSSAAMEIALTDPAWQVRIEAVEYFAGLGGSGLADRLGPRLADRHIAVRLAAERALYPH
jgi:beta-lactamase regulating signal transducer with metallopeptidase domain